MPEETRSQTDAVVRARLNARFMVHLIRLGDESTGFAEDILRSEGYQVASTAGFQELHQAPAAVIVWVSASQHLEIIKQVKQVYDAAVVFAAVAANNAELAVQTMHRGAQDVFTLPLRVDRLVAGVREISHRNLDLKGYRDGESFIRVQGYFGLTPREKIVLEYLLNGYTNKTCSNALNISPRTVEMHRAQIMKKLGAKNPFDLARILLKSGVDPCSDILST
ncbi:DNA-binding response regulator [Devosia pacifica]|uniref:DNA-binding response regulator n=1 Tax=Devosia pacifica TaxID=1335967 RepID=A0A918VVJ7_9HYPH|nr:LuxR family transcriptional regulator [Devosia pacifica]GHA29772.1 DNA-binding response regulator [Devosia pacifica]